MPTLGKTWEEHVSMHVQMFALASALGWRTNAGAIHGNNMSMTQERPSFAAVLSKYRRYFPVSARVANEA